MTRPRLALLSGAAVLATLLLSPMAGRANDYPTAAVADYVLGCMAANGDTAQALRQCSCSIDVVASLLTYPDYTMAETVLSMRQVAGGGEKMELFRDTKVAKDAVARLRRAQVEAEVRCFL